MSQRAEVHARGKATAAIKLLKAIHVGGGNRPLEAQADGPVPLKVCCWWIIYPIYI